MAALTTTLSWSREGLVFRGGQVGGPEVVTDGSGTQGPSPMALLAVSLAGCMAIDVLDITQKMRLPVTNVQVVVEGDRRDEVPKHFTALRLKYVVSGLAAAEREKVQRAIDLSREKFCSVLHSLRQDIEISIELELQQAGG